MNKIRQYGLRVDNAPAFEKPPLRFKIVTRDDWDMTLQYSLPGSTFRIDLPHRNSTRQIMNFLSIS